MSSKVRTPQKVMVEWVDICSPGNYWDDESEWGTMKCFTLGYIARRTKKELAVAHTICADGTFGGVMSIPVGAILKVVKLK